MRTRAEVLPDKLRGGYYTAPHVVDFCLRRALALHDGTPPATWLEPAAGDGAFLRGLETLLCRGDLPAADVVAIERDEGEAAKCRRLLTAGALAGRVHAASFFAWAATDPRRFDAVVGNPPYVRYQFVSDDDRRIASRLVRAMGLELPGVANLWIPFALVSLDRLRCGGVFALVLPGELLATVSAGPFRDWLVAQCTDVRLDLVSRATFPGLLQDVVVVSGRRAADVRARRPVTLCTHADERADGAARGWTHEIAASDASWSRYLLTADELAALAAATRLDAVHRLGALARLEVAIVTGANGFFTVTDEVRRGYRLEPWTRPLLARTADCPGLVCRPTDHDASRAAGRRVWLLDFAADRATPDGERPAAYLAAGVTEGLPQRYKCRTRRPWYRVPHVRCGTLMMTKRAHRAHRLLLNEAGVFTTDTIYRGVMHPAWADRAADLVAGFQNTMTRLAAEIEGRTYGGGVLELVPSEIARLAVPLVEMAPLLPRLDAASRAGDGQRDATDAVLDLVDDALRRSLPGYGDVLPTLAGACRRLLARRQTARRR